MRRETRGVVANLLDYDIIVSKFELQSSQYIHFRTNTLGSILNPLIPSDMDLIVSLLCFYMDGLGIEESTMVDKLLNKENKYNRNSDEILTISTYFKPPQKGGYMSGVKWHALECLVVFFFLFFFMYQPFPGYLTPD